VQEQWSVKCWNERGTERKEIGEKEKRRAVEGAKRGRSRNGALPPKRTGGGAGTSRMDAEQWGGGGGERKEMCGSRIETRSVRIALIYGKNGHYKKKKAAWDATYCPK